MKRIILLLFVQSFFIFQGTQGLELESLFTPCGSKDPKLNECVKEAGKKFIPKLAAGISEWKIESIDPMITPHVTFENADGDNRLKVEYKDIVQTGFSTIEIENVQVDLEHKVMTFKLKYPYISFTADYAAKGKFFGFELDGNGKANISVWNAYSSFVLKYHLEADHIRRDSVIFGFSFDKIYLDYSNLMVNGDEELSKSAGNFVNENANVIIDGFKPQLEEFYSSRIGECLDRFFEAIPYSVLFKA